MLTKLTIQGFKSIERQTIELGALNVLMGANGSGKSNLHYSVGELLKTLGQGV